MIDCLVIGAGHCGLICGYLLERNNINYLIVDAADRIGDVWRQRSKSLKLFTSRQFCQLANFAMPGDPQDFPTAAEFADYMELFSVEHSIAVAMQSKVIRLSQSDEVFSAELADGRIIHSKTVINATGSNQVPIIPAFSKKLSPFVQNTKLLPNTTIAIIGDGASGRQLAQELSKTHRVLLARGRKRNLLPNMIFGRDIFWWLTKIGVLFAHRDSLLAKIIKKRDPIPAASVNDRMLINLGVILKTRAVDAQNTELFFDDGSRERIDNVIWCCGYREKTDWIDLPYLEKTEGFYIIGRKWLTCRASELILGAERDAVKVIKQVKERVRVFPYA